MISTIGHILHHTHYFYIQLAAVLYKDYGDEDETSRDREEANNKSEKMKAHSVYCILLLFYISIRDRIFQYYNIIWHICVYEDEHGKDVRYEREIKGHTKKRRKKTKKNIHLWEKTRENWKGYIFPDLFPNSNFQIVLFFGIALSSF